MFIPTSLPCQLSLLLSQILTHTYTFAFPPYFPHLCCQKLTKSTRTFGSLSKGEQIHYKIVIISFQSSHQVHGSIFEQMCIYPPPPSPPRGLAPQRLQPQQHQTTEGSTSATLPLLRPRLSSPLLLTSHHQTPPLNFGVPLSGYITREVFSSPFLPWHEVVVAMCVLLRRRN